MFKVEIEPGKEARFRYPPRVVDRVTIRRNAQDLAGGVQALADLEASLADVRGRAQAELVAAFGEELAQQIRDQTPGVDTEQLRGELAEVMEGPTFRCLAALDDHLSYLFALAEWPVLWLEGPRGWRDLGEQQIDHGKADAIIGAYRAAREAVDRETAAGKAPSSES